MEQTLITLALILTMAWVEDITTASTNLAFLIFNLKIKSHLREDVMATT